MLLDVVNNVVLHVEPERRRTLERRARMRFQLQLHQDQDPRHLIHELQTQVTLFFFARFPHTLDYGLRLLPARIAVLSIWSLDLGSFMNDCKHDRTLSSTEGIELLVSIGPVGGDAKCATEFFFKYKKKG